MRFKNSILRILTIIMICLLPNCTKSVEVNTDNPGYCNAVQDDAGLIRYPLGTIAVSATDAAEIADAMTLVPRVYPCLNSVVVRGEKEKWSRRVSGDPSMLIVEYLADKPSGASKSEITVTPHMSVFRVTFPAGNQNKYLVFDFSKYRVDDWAELYKWTERSVTRIDDRTIRAAIGEPGRSGAYYTIRFSEPCVGYGTYDSTGVINDGANKVSGKMLGMYAQFNSPTVTVAVAESFTSMEKTGEFLTAEFTDFDTAQKNCRAAWNKALNRIEIKGSENNKRMAYTALYSMYVNIINGSDGSCYLQYYSNPKSLTSSAYWQFIGGFQSCCWDNFRTAYPFLMLGYPEVMSDIVNTYLARYQRDGYVAGNICLFTGPTGGHLSVRFTPVLIAEAYENGIKADYAQLYAALKDNYADDKYVPSSLATLGYVTQPPSGGKACSETLEWSTSIYSLAMLARANDDTEEMTRYLNMSNSYKNVWDSANQVFRVKNADGTWGVIENKTNTWNPNPQGLFEGTNRDWMFYAPHDPYGLIDLPGQNNFVERVIEYCLNDTWFNDYQYHYPYLLYYAGAANEAQKILRNVWVPLFNKGIIYEGVSPRPSYKPWKTHYTSNAGWLICSMLGLYPAPSPSGQYIITSPTVTETVIHNGDRSIAVRARNNSEKNIYIKSINVNDKIYPCYMIPAQQLIDGVNIELEMGSDPDQGLGGLYIGSSDGFVRSAELISETHLKCTIEAAVTDATTKIFSRTRPAKVTVNGVEDMQPKYDETTGTLTVHSTGFAVIEVM